MTFERRLAPESSLFNLESCFCGNDGLRDFEKIMKRSLTVSPEMSFDGKKKDTIATRISVLGILGFYWRIKKLRINQNE